MNSELSRIICFINIYMGVKCNMFYTKCYAYFFTYFVIYLIMLQM